MIYIEPLKI